MDDQYPGQRITELAEKWLNGSITPEEEKEFADWYNAQQDKEVLVPASFAGNREELRNRMLKTIRGRMQRPKLWPRVAAAAIFLLLAGGLYWLSDNNKTEAPVAQTQPAEKTYPKDILPGSDKAILTLADNSTIILDNSGNDTLVKQGNSYVVKLDDGRLSYTAAKKGRKQDNLYNTVTTPRGGQYQVVLPDGTKVWLNAASSVRFPVLFSGQERRIQVSGEVYLEVTKNAAQPFYVDVLTANGPGSEIQVLGTHFNIMAYDDEQMIATTLLEGSVKISHGIQTGTLVPGQQATIDQRGDIRIKKADTEEAVAWKNGMLLYNAANIKKIMRQVSRWYDVDIEFKGNMTGMDYDCAVSRQSNVSALLRMLELTGTVHFEIEEKKIVVSPK